MIVFLLVLCVTMVVAKAFFVGDGVHSTRCDSARTERQVGRNRTPKVAVKPKSKDGAVLSQQMASSTFPVRMQVRGSALCVTSDYCQLLPIYTRGGTFYMAMRLNKGLNWLSGLPRGRYLINNQSVVIP